MPSNVFPRNGVDTVPEEGLHGGVGFGILGYVAVWAKFFGGRIAFKEILFGSVHGFNPTGFPVGPA